MAASSESIEKPKGKRKTHPGRALTPFTAFDFCVVPFLKWLYAIATAHDRPAGDLPSVSRREPCRPRGVNRIHPAGGGELPNSQSPAAGAGILARPGLDCYRSDYLRSDV